MQISISNVIGRAIILGSYISKLIKAFKARVAADIGIFEAELCLSTTLKSLNTIGLLDKTSLCITPNAYKESILYSVVPNTTLGDMTVVRATTATRVNSDGFIESVGLNVPRIDYTNGSCPSLLVEPQRTNFLTYSEQFDNAGWLKALTNVTPNSIVSPDGNTNADTITPDTSLGNHWIGRTTLTLVSGTAYSYSVFAKNNGYNLVISVGSATIYTNCNFNLSNGTTSTPYATAGANLCSPVITNIGNGWYKCTINFTVSMVSNALLFSSNNTTTTPIGPFGMTNMSGNGTSGFYLWGAQLEVGSYATSYVPTVASSSTRNADVISKTGISSLIGQTEGTIFFDGTINNIQNIFTNILNTNKTPSTSSQIALSKVKASNKFNFDQFYGDGTFERITLLSTNSFANGIRTKVAIRYKSGDFAMYINGNLEATSSTAFTNIGAKSELFLNDSETFFAYQESVSFNNAILFKTALSNTELQSLTTL